MAAVRLSENSDVDKFEAFGLEQDGCWDPIHLTVNSDARELRQPLSSFSRCPVADSN